MSGFSFRRRDPDEPEQDAGAAAVEQGDERAADTATSTIEHIAEYSSRGADNESVAVPATVDSPSSSEAGLGTRIDTIVAAAEQAAEQIRRDAEVEAARVREEAASARADADRTIAEAGDKARGVREAAGAYAAGKQREADEEAGSIIAGAEDRARSLESETAKRRQALADETKRWQENLLQLVGMCRALADDLEALGQALHEAVPAGDSPGVARLAVTVPERDSQELPAPTYEPTRA